MYEFTVVKSDSPLGFSVVPHETEYLGHEAKMAWSFADKILLSDGMKEIIAEQSAEVQRDTVQQIAVRACELAEYLMAEMKLRDWIYTAPGLKEAAKKVK